MSEDLVRKMYILDSRYGAIREDMFSMAAAELGIKLRIDMETYRRSRNLPENYDFYFLHISDVDISEVEHLKREQPWSYLIGFSGAYFLDQARDGKLFDKQLSDLIKYEDYFLLLKEMMGNV